ncbi:MazG nucleotide pyrophosphohydrolase domain-containing protein [Brevibacterium oceani]|uniref:MazG nucleotide pyrophosphohydrolase domain-containing protein n=1 Tax=Brevibacterium oceani TaxID=358099 RepID=UPI0028111FB4|nr:MazG nucleotide pyrophosphohydrolase domain-containing protein [Brevibacterium oceani]
MGECDEQSAVERGADQVETGAEHAETGAEQVEPRLQPVIDAMAILRRRCPWSSRQDHQSLEKYAREETEELIDALEDYVDSPSTTHRAAVVDELGDVFYQVLFHSALLDESGGHEYGHSLGAIIDGLQEKLIRRHPLAFGDDAEGAMADLDDVEREYRRIKSEEKAEKNVENNGAENVSVTAMTHEPEDGRR